MSPFFTVWCIVSFQFSLKRTAIPFKPLVIVPFRIQCLQFNTKLDTFFFSSYHVLSTAPAALLFSWNYCFSRAHSSNVFLIVRLLLFWNRYCTVNELFEIVLRTGISLLYRPIDGQNSSYLNTSDKIDSCKSIRVNWLRFDCRKIFEWRKWLTLIQYFNRMKLTIRTKQIVIDLS